MIPLGILISGKRRPLRSVGFRRRRIVVVATENLCYSFCNESILILALHISRRFNLDDGGHHDRYLDRVIASSFFSIFIIVRQCIESALCAGSMKRSAKNMLEGANRIRRLRNMIYGFYRALPSVFFRMSIRTESHARDLKSGLFERVTGGFLSFSRISLNKSGRLITIVFSVYRCYRGL